MVGILEVGKRIHRQKEETNILRVLYKQYMSPFGTPTFKTIVVLCDK